MRVVLIDDNEADLRFLENRVGALFPDAPWKLVMFRNGTLAIEHIRRHVGERILIICDERMAHLNGSDVLRILHQEALLDGVQFHLLSGHDTASYPDAVGARRHVKPNDLEGTDDLLRQVIDEWLAVAT